MNLSFKLYTNDSILPILLSNLGTKVTKLNVKCLILLSRLASDFGLKGNVMKWISSYLANRTTSVCVNAAASEHLGGKKSTGN